jgi:gluconolactonase
VFVYAANGECIARIKSCAGPTCTNIALSADGRRIVITESSTGIVMTADLAF